MNPTATRLVEAAARRLATDGEAAVTARRVTAEVGVSTMAVYTHFGSREGLLAAIWTEGFARFGAELDAPALTADPVADLMAQAWGYRHFARREPHLYQVMFGPGLESINIGSPEDELVGGETFFSLLARLERCTAADRFSIEDLCLAGEVVWAAVHGHCQIELTGFHAQVGREPIASYAEIMVRLAIGFGDEPATARASMGRARTRARRAGQLD